MLAALALLKPHYFLRKLFCMPAIKGRHRRCSDCAEYQFTVFSSQLLCDRGDRTGEKLDMDAERKLRTDQEMAAEATELRKVMEQVQ